ncbi:MAG: hypothetical protein O3B65_03695 [Chloroflexi bacterium]|nr:hypothetical protein [Chloroflexota bacterium]
MVRDPLIVDVPGAAYLAATPFQEAPSLVKTNVVDDFVSAVRARTPWGEALVAAIGQWSAPAEVVDGDELTYLLAGEAFDWLRLAERLLRALDEALPGTVPLEERDRVLFHGGLPKGVTPERFREGLGPEKYRAHLNYFYGVVVEEALWQAVERETVKERGVRGLHHPLGLDDLVSQKLYRTDADALLRRFWREQDKRPAAKFTLSQWKQFSYWRFKLRVGRQDSSRTASDTRKGLTMLEELWGFAPQTHGGLDFDRVPTAEAES